MPEAHQIDPKQLRPNPWNTNIVGPENEAKIDAAIKKFGFFKPIVVREVKGELEILGGEHRWRSAVRLDLAEVPIFNLGPIDDKTAKEISIADNARYGADDVISFAQLLSELGPIEDIKSFLPYTDSDIASIFASVDIVLDELDLDDSQKDEFTTAEPKSAKAPKTHTIMRFKISNGDAERITTLIEKIKKRHAFTKSDDLTNAGDALAFVIFNSAEAKSDE